MEKVKAKIKQIAFWLNQVKVALFIFLIVVWEVLYWLGCFALSWCYFPAALMCFTVGTKEIEKWVSKRYDNLLNNYDLMEARMRRKKMQIKHQAV